MISVDSNSKVSVDKELKESLPRRRAIEAEEAAALVNQLYAEIAANKGDVAVGGRPSQGPTQTAQKYVKQGIELVSKKKGADPAAAVECYNKALEAVLSRPLYESMEVTMGEVCQVLGPRCDAYIAGKQWAKAYADASMVLLLNPKDPQAYFRKAVCLYEADKVDEAEIMLQYASLLAPQNPSFATFLEKVQRERKNKV